MTHRWSRVRRGFTARHAHVSVVYKNFLFAFGGISDGKVLDDFNSYNIGINQIAYRVYIRQEKME